MDNEMDNSSWNAPAVSQPPLPVDYYALDQMSFLDGDIGSRNPEWLLSTRNGMGNTTTSSDSPRYRPNMTTLPFSSANEISTAQPADQTHATTIDLGSVLKDLTERVEQLEQSQRVMEKSQTKIVMWTLDVNTAQTKLARQVAEKTNVPIMEETEWHMAEVTEPSQA